jgi:hypothetical protein
VVERDGELVLVVAAILVHQRICTCSCDYFCLKLLSMHSCRREAYKGEEAQVFR